MFRRIALGACAVTLFAAAGCGYQLPPNTPPSPDLGFNMTPTGCAGNVDNVGNTCYLADLIMVAHSGAHSVRIDDPWDFVEPTAPGPHDNPQADCVVQQLLKNCWHWNTIDQRVRAAEALGMKVLLVPTYAPPWAALAGCKSTRCGPDPSHVPDYAHFVDESVQRYGPGGVMKTHVTSWEIWNEPNGPGFGPRADPAEYTDMLQLAYTAIRSHAGSKNADVVTGGTAPASNDKKSDTSFKPVTWLRCLYDNSLCDPNVHNSAKGYFTAVGHHPYSGTVDPLANYDWNAFLQTQDLYQVMQANGDGGKKIWATEFGYSSDTNPTFGVGIAGQADFIVKAVIDWHRWKFGGPMYLYDIRSGYNPAETDSSRPDAVRDKFTTAGVLNYDYSFKSAAYAMFSLIHGNMQQGKNTNPGSGLPQVQLASLPAIGGHASATIRRD